MRRPLTTTARILFLLTWVGAISCGADDPRQRSSEEDDDVLDGSIDARDAGRRTDAPISIDANRIDAPRPNSDVIGSDAVDTRVVPDANGTPDADASVMVPDASTGDAGGRDAATGGGGPITSSAQWAKVDFDMAGRPSTETTELGFTAWPVEAGMTISASISGVKYTLTKMGNAGSGLKSTWSKVAVTAPNYARLVGDGVTVDGGDSGGQIQMTIQGLSPGPHTLATYHNHVGLAAGTTVAPLDLRINGVSAVSKLAPSVGALTTDTAQMAYLQLTAKANEEVVILFSTDTSSSATVKNVILNGFELDTPNPRKQARDPSPDDGDEHVDADSSSVMLGWKTATGAVSHDVYVSERIDDLKSPTRASPAFKGNQKTTSFPLQSLSRWKPLYWRIDEVDAQQGVTPGDIWYFRPRQLAFREAYGYGRFARGGRGGIVVHVTSLNDSGAGTLREAVTDVVGPRTVVFDVSGVIKLASRLTINDRYITVAGQTAPGKGIVVRAAPFGSSGARDLVIQNVRVRLGAGPTYDGMGLTGCDHCIIDHASISWTIDEGFSSRGAKNITLQRSLISECLNIAGHQNYPAGTAHGYAATIGGDTGSFHHNLLAHCEGRNWSMGGGLDAAGNFSGRLDIFNNVVYNWGGRTTDGGAHEVNFVANYYKPGAATRKKVALTAQYDNFPGTQRYFFSQNVMLGVFDESNQNAGREVAGTPQGYDPWVTAPFFPSYTRVESAGDAYKSVLSDVGNTQPVFDDHDVRVVRETLQGTTTYKGSISGSPGLPDHENDVGGYESYPTVTREKMWDSDGDGLPDWWEAKKGSNPKSPAGDFSDTNADPDNDGFTAMDDYLEWMAAPHFVVTSNADIDVDLAKLFAGYSGATYAVPNAIGGSASLNGSTVSFKPSRCGFVSWRVTATDKAGSSSSKDIGAYVGTNGTLSCP
ncbi:MAG: T9SS C-terminal target domain-containing protein [Polyangiaceae bacterium]